MIQSETYKKNNETDSTCEGTSSKIQTKKKNVLLQHFFLVMLHYNITKNQIRLQR